MRRVGMKDLRTRLPTIWRDVQQNGTEYIITCRGRPVGRLTPMSAPSQSATPLDQGKQVWDELVRLGAELARSWPAGTSSGEVLAEMCE